MALIHGFVRWTRVLALAGAAGGLVLVAADAEGDVGTDELLLLVVVLAAPALLLFFAQGVAQLASLPERVRRMPVEGQQRAGELARLAAEARTARARRVPLLLWRLRGTVGGLRDLAGIALPFRVFTPFFLAAAAVSASVCALLVLLGLLAGAAEAL
jgi:hypothetical protein